VTGRVESFSAGEEQALRHRAVATTPPAATIDVEAGSPGVGTS